MIAPNEFWLHLHLLMEAYEAEGQTPDARAESTVAHFHNLPRVTQRELLRDLVQLVTHGQELYSLIIAATKQGHASGKGTAETDGTGLKVGG